MNVFELAGSVVLGMESKTETAAKLKVTNTKFEISTSADKKYVFAPSDIDNFEIIDGGENSRKGLIIHHNVPYYHRELMFLSLANPEKLIANIKAIGFTDNSYLSDYEKGEILKAQKRSGLPMKLVYLKGAFVFWNICMVLLVVNFMLQFTKINFMFVGAVTMLAASILGLVSGGLRNAMLKEGRKDEELKKLLYSLIATTAFLSLISYFLMDFS